MATEDKDQKTDSEKPDAPAEKLLTQADFDKGVQKKTASYLRERDALKAELDATQQEREALAARVAEFENKGKSAEDIYREQLQSHEKQRKALAEQLKAKDDALASERKARQEEAFNARLLAAVSGAAHPARAALIARAEIPGLTIGEDGKLVLVDPVTDVPGDAEGAIKAWLHANPDLLPASGGGPKTNGGAAPGAPARKGPLDGLAPGAPMIGAAFFGRR